MSPSAVDSPSISIELRRALLELALESEALETALIRLSEAAIIGQMRPAGDARWAQIGAALAMKDGDHLFGTARDLPAALARGLSASTAMCQAFAVTGDPGLGRSWPGAVREAKTAVDLGDGSMAAHLVHAAGFGHAAELCKGDRIAVGLFGDAAFDDGNIHAALNTAAVAKARVVFVLRGVANQAPDMAEVGPAWGLRTMTVRGDDGAAVFEAVAQARQLAVAGQGPTLVDARLPRTVEPLDARALQALSQWNQADAKRIKGEVAARITQARNDADGAAPIDESTLSEAVFAERPWWLDAQEWSR